MSPISQNFGAVPTEIRESDHYVHEYISPFVDKWDELIDWQKRSQAEGSFVIDKLKEYGAHRVLDIATGTGFHSVRLLEAGFDVTSVDGSAEMLAKAFDNGRKNNCLLNTKMADWRWLSKKVQDRYDAVICLGNSFTHLFSERDRRKVLAEIYAVLKYDGILILDQYNYDAVFENGSSPGHRCHYCGESVKVEPEHIDEGLARFKYQFADGTVYYLNMFPLRRKYLRRLIREAGFQHIDTCGDFRKPGDDEEPGFWTHVVEKVHEPGRHARPLPRHSYSKSVNVAREYYNSDDADNFYFTIWGGEDIHIGIYDNPDESIFIASRRTVERIASRVSITPETNIIDIGSGYGGAARFLAKTHGCQVTALNLSEVENGRNRDMNAVQGVDHLIDVVDGSFEDIPFPDESFDIVWSQDAILHSGEREAVIEEVARLLRPGGSFVFTDPMMADDCPRNVLQPILVRIHLETLGSPWFYRDTASRFGLREASFTEYTPQLITHYSRVLAETERREKELTDLVSEGYISNMKKGLNHWIEGGSNGYLVWGIFHFIKQ